MSFPAGMFPRLTSSQGPIPPSNAFSPFNGFSQGATGENSVSMGPFGTQRLDYKTGNIQAQDSEAIPIRAQYVSAHKSIGELRANTLMGSITYAASPKDVKHWRIKAKVDGLKDSDAFSGIPSNPVYTNEDPKYDKVMEKVEFMSLSRLLRFLKSKEGRATFGVKTDFADVDRVWKFAGIDGTAIADNFGESDEMVKGMIVGKRARIKDITGIHKIPIQMNQRLYLVWFRVKYTEDTLMDLDVKAAEGWRNGTESYPFPPDAKGPGAGIVPGMPNSNVLSGAAGGAAADAKKQDEYYWTCIPWICDRGRCPPEQLYKTSSFIGKSEYIGLCMDRYGEKVSSMTQAKTAAFLYPETDTDKWKREGADLPEIVIFVLVG